MHDQLKEQIISDLKGVFGDVTISDDGIIRKQYVHGVYDVGYYVTEGEHQGWVVDQTGDKDQLLYYAGT